MALMATVGLVESIEGLGEIVGWTKIVIDSELFFLWLGDNSPKPAELFERSARLSMAKQAFETGQPLTIIHEDTSAHIRWMALGDSQLANFLSLV